MKCRIKLWASIAACGSLLMFIGCDKPASKGPGNAGPGKDGHAEHGHGHEHASEGPHHGHLIELGAEEYHAELTHDDATEKVTIYLLDSGAKKSVATAAQTLTINLTTDGKPSQFSLVAVPDSGDPLGQSSRFELVDKNLHEALESKATKGRLNVTVGSKTFVGTIEHAGHEEDKHGHKH